MENWSEIILQLISVYSHGVMIKALDCGIVVDEFEFQLRRFDPFRINVMNTLILPTMDERVPPLFFKKNGFGIK